MTKREIVMRIAEEIGDGPMAEKAQHLTQDVLLAIVQETLDIILDAVARGETVELRNFGVFEVKVRKARIGRNPNSPTADVPIPPRAVVKFKPGKEMREQVLKLTPDKAPKA
ncbi:MAG: HU family DNA-binding protein [Verrucomicrobiota bacterium]